MVHKLKTWPEEFEAVLTGQKNFELRENDRQFCIGDTLRLQEFKPCATCRGSGRVWDGGGDKTECGECDDLHGVYTSASVDVIVTYVLKGGRFGLPENKVILSTARVNGRREP